MAKLDMSSIVKALNKMAREELKPSCISCERLNSLANSCYLDAEERAEIGNICEKYKPRGR